MKKFKVRLPQLNKQNIKAIYAQLRPYRQGGYRIQSQKISDKFIFHNYGQGGSGISLSYGSVIRSVKLWRQSNIQQKNQLCIIGSGIIGLLTALQLSKYNKKVTLYSENIPKFGRKNNKQMITSQIAPGFWFPYDYLFEKHLDTVGIAKDTIQFLKDAKKNNKYLAVQQCQTFDQLYGSQIFQALNNTLLEEYNKVKVDFGNGTLQQFTRFKTYRIDMQLWIKQLMEEISLTGVRFVEKQFESLEDVKNLSQKVVFNCSGYGSRYLFDDKKMKPMRGHIVQFENPDPLTFDYIFGTKIDGITVRIYCHQNRILLGLTKEQTETIQIDQKAVNKLLRGYQAYFNKVTIPNAKL